MNDVIYRKDVLELLEEINDMLDQTLEDFTLAYPTTEICEFCRNVIKDLTDDVKEIPAGWTPWISCKLKLPKPNEYVLVQRLTDLEIAYLSEDRTSYEKGEYRTSHEKEWCFEEYCLSGEDFDDVVAWMPLPEPLDLSKVQFTPWEELKSED